MNEWMYNRLNEWMNEWMNEWLADWLTDWLYCFTLFYTIASVHSTAKQLLQIIHTSLAQRKSFQVMPSERYIPAKVFMLGRTGTNEPQMGR